MSLLIPIAKSIIDCSQNATEFSNALLVARFFYYLKNSLPLCLAYKTRVLTVNSQQQHFSSFQLHTVEKKKN